MKVSYAKKKHCMGSKVITFLKIYLQLLGFLEDHTSVCIYLISAFRYAPSVHLASEVIYDSINIQSHTDYSSARRSAIATNGKPL